MEMDWNKAILIHLNCHYFFNLYLVRGVSLRGSLSLLFHTSSPGSGPVQPQFHPPATGQLHWGSGPCSRVMSYHKLASLTFRATTAAQNGLGFNMLHLLWICDSLLYMQNIIETSVDWPFSYILLFRHLFFSLLHHREALAVKDRERKSNSTTAVTYNHEHLELLSHLIFSQVFFLWLSIYPTIFLR